MLYLTRCLLSDDQISIYRSIGFDFSAHLGPWTTDLTTHKKKQKIQFLTYNLSLSRFVKNIVFHYKQIYDYIFIN